MVVAQKNNVNTDRWPISPQIKGLKSSILREILKTSSQPGVISFAGGLPAPELFPLDDIKLAMDQAMTKYGGDTTQYSLTLGIPMLRELLAQRASARHTETAVENIIVTAGGQQALELVGRTFVTPGQYVLCEYPTYVGALQVFNAYQAKYAPVAMDHDGMIIDEVEEKIKKYRPTVIYTVSNFQNPTGITLSLERRHALIELATRYEIPIVDDNPYGDIRFAGDPIPTLKSIGGDAVIAVRTFSKTMAPGFRVGWLNGPKDIIPYFERAKQAIDLHTNTLNQYIIHEYVAAGKLEPHIELIKSDYVVKRDLMMRSLNEFFPEGCTWTNPEGGLFLWVELPRHLSAKSLLPQAIERKVAYVYGEPFFPDGSGDHTLRLNFSNASHENIVEGIKRLGQLFTENL
ncbi:MAG: PLP-dependent aminotransferase family protein [candidate division Zixibacteria bacterium]|nr:PLP-dependent aminotransferase family protein [candidate division Zixibacteria bacterium]MDH3935791.1 PLP-dependent aminotransferase family protein [candidate division Zixibacteria bacterium]